MQMACSIIQTTDRSFMEEDKPMELQDPNASADATLSNKNGYTVFSFNDYVIKFKAPCSSC